MHKTGLFTSLLWHKKKKKKSNILHSARDSYMQALTYMFGFSICATTSAYGSWIIPILVPTARIEAIRTAVVLRIFYMGMTKMGT